MNFQRNYKAGFSFIIVIFTLLCFSSIVIVESSVPQINAFFASQMQAQESFQKILLLLSALDERGPDARQTAFAEELKKLRSNIQHEAKQRALDVLELQYPAATRGDPVARLQILQAIEGLSALQQEDFEKASEDLHIGSVSSGWAIAFLGIVGFLVILTILSRFKSLILDPLSEIISVIQDYDNGNRMRRFNKHQATPELRATIEILNEILDRTTHQRS